MRGLALINYLLLIIIFILLIIIIDYLINYLTFSNNWDNAQLGSQSISNRIRYFDFI